MSHSRDSSPVYYREIQKNAYLKRVPDDVTTTKSLGLRPLGLKKAPLKPLWTQLCVHNGRTPYLEQYRDPAAARAHRPAWRASLATARHVTASVTPRDNEYDFLVDTHEGPVRMLAPDWESMQDWVSCLRSRLHELRILPPCENVYCAAPAPAAPRAAARDPTSPLPPAPLPPDRIPGIDLTPLIRNAAQTTETTEEESQPTISTTTTTNNTPTPSTSQARPTTNTTNSRPTNNSAIPSLLTSETVDISSWDPQEATDFTSLPSTSQVPKSVTKICGQNICLDDSIFKRTCDSDDDDFLSDQSSLGSKTNSLNSKVNSVGNKVVSSVSKDASSKTTVGSDIQSASDNSEVNSYRQTVVVNDGHDKEAEDADNYASDRPTNITVIQVSNKEPPHTAIPVIGHETDIFDFSFKSATKNPNFINIVNTEVNVQNSNEYGTVFSKNEPEYGHLSLTTTVNLTGDVKLTAVRNDGEGIYEKLCLASTSNESKASPLSIRRLISQEKVRKSSLPNLDAINSDSTYEYLFLSQNNNSTSEISTSNTTTISNVTATHSNVTATHSNITATNSNITATNSNITATNSNITATNSNIAATQRILPPRPLRQNMVALGNAPINAANVTISTNAANPEINRDTRVHVNSVSIGDSNSREIRSNVDRTNSQNTYDLSPRREARLEHNGPKRNGKVEKTEPVQPKPIWKRGLTELSLLTRLRGIAHGKRQDSPDRQNDRSAVTSPAKVVHRSRPEARVDRTRRRSSSLSNGQSPPTITPALQTLRTRQAAALRGEQTRGAALVAAVRCADPPVLVDYNKRVWVAWWGSSGARVAGRAGDRVCGVRGAVPRDAAHARALLAAHQAVVDVLFHRVPLGKIYVINKRDQENTGIKLDNECNITSVEGGSPAAVAGLPPPGKWALTEINNRPLNLIKTTEEDINRLSLRGTETSVLIQPSALVKKLRAALKGNKAVLGLR